MGFFANLDTEGYDRQYTDRELTRRMMVYFKPHRAQITAIMALLLLLAIVGAILPIVLARGIDLVRLDASNRNIAFLFWVLLGLGVLSWVINWARRRITVRAIAQLELDLRSDAFEAAMAHDLSFYDQYPSGKIVSRITSDTRDFSNLVTLITDLGSQFVQGIILGGALVAIDGRLALLVFAFLPLIFLFAISFRRIARSVTRQGMRAMANVNSAIKETISGIAVAKNFRQEAMVFDAFNEANQQSYRVNIKRGLILGMVFPVLNVLSGFGTAVVVYAGGWSVVAAVITYGSWQLFLQSLDRFFFPVLNLSSFWAQVQSGLSSAERIFALIDAEPAVKQFSNDPVPPLNGDIRFEHVDFRYTEKEPVLEDFNLHIRAGENLAIVGHTGSGKSSLAKLITRFYEFQGGRLLIDGRDIRSFDLALYRQQMGIVSQAPFLFSGTVMENICYACTSQPDPSEVEALAGRIGSGDWLNTLPDGLQTQVGERGALLSMGQRQLVSLMRVLVQKPAIFILDEATASIDPFTEWQIQQALNLILADATSILIAHRLSTVKAADRIIVLDHGKIIEEGNHEGLLGRKGHYAMLYNTYFRHQSLHYVEEAKSFAAG
ncbi:MAG: ABC transporter ATP-binding protein [Chloroflexota bacterium]